MCIFKKKKEKNERDLSNINNILTITEHTIYNYEIVNILNNYLSIARENYNEYLRNQWVIDFTSSNEVSIKSPNDKDYFHILVTPSLNEIDTLGVDYSEKDGTHIINILINMDKEKNNVLYTKKEVERKIQGRNNDTQAMINKTTIKNFIDDELKYHYEYYVESCFRLDQNFSKAHLSEVYVDMNNHAVKRVASISENILNEDNATDTYYESDDYREEPFINYYNYDSSKTEMVPSSQKKFEEFINGPSNILSLKRK